MNVLPILFAIRSINIYLIALVVNLFFFVSTITDDNLNGIQRKMRY